MARIFTRIFTKSRIAVLTITAAAGIAIPAIAKLIDADDVLRRIDESARSSQPGAQSPAADLLADIKRFRADAGAMDAAKAAHRWLELYDRAARLGAPEWRGDFRVFDPETSNVVGLQSVLAALPGPDSWAALREGASTRAQQAPGDVRALALRFIAEVLTADAKAGAATLAEAERLAEKSAPAERDALRGRLAYVRSEMARLYGSPQDIAGTFVASLDAYAKQQYGNVAVPDLVSMVGVVKAHAILGEALSKPVGLYVPEGAATRTLARKIALERAASLPVPQWGLVDGMEGAELYEALERRFSGGGAKEERYGSRKQEAHAYYFLSLVVKGRHADAEKALRALTGAGELHVPKSAVEALQRAGYDAALFEFLHSLLARRPEIRAWDVYIRQAAYTGHSAGVLVLIDDLLKRKDLPGHVRADLRFHRINALLAADKIEPAVAELRELLAAPPAQGERTLQARTDAALKLAGLGRVLKRQELAEAGLSFARAVLALPADRDSHWRRAELLKGVFAEQRSLGRLEEAQALAVEELKRSAAAGRDRNPYGYGAPSGERIATVELAGLYGQAKRHADVIILLDQSTQWGAGDLRELLAEKDSLGVPVALTAARALVETGNRAAALEVVRALIETLPGYDPAYELLAELDKDVNAYLDKVYARDRFEERPLIWKAIVLHRLGRDVEAESLIRQAIVIDPSDGEEGPNDRMRAYAVLADVLEGKGAKTTAVQFRKAVQAIRISERSDELRRLGLYEQAFAGYREALGYFSDAYCIQSRLAIGLMEQGRRQEAFEHYRRAYELMPSSFGRVESHCFGCESAFQGAEQQQIAEKVFSEFLEKNPKKPQVHYLLGYLYKERGRYPEALKRFRESVNLDAEYLNAWKHLHELGGLVYIEPRERDLSRMKLLELDPRRRHVRYTLDSVGDLAGLWRAIDTAGAGQPVPGESMPLYRLRRSAAAASETYAKLPEEERLQMQQIQAFMSASRDDNHSVPLPRQAIAKHRLVKASARLMGVKELGQDE